MLPTVTNVVLSAAILIQELLILLILFQLYSLLIPRLVNLSLDILSFSLLPLSTSKVHHHQNHYQLSNKHSQTNPSNNSRIFQSPNQQSNKQSCTYYIDNADHKATLNQTQTSSRIIIPWHSSQFWYFRMELSSVFPQPISSINIQRVESIIQLILLVISDLRLVYFSSFHSLFTKFKPQKYLYFKTPETHLLKQCKINNQA